MSTLTETLAGMQAKTDAATPGEWGAFQKVADDAEFSMDDDMDTTTSSVECITGLRAEDGVGRFCITIADPIVSAVDAEFIATARTAMPRLLAAVEAIRALHYDAGASQGYGKDGYGVIDHCCNECGTFGEYGVEWPCPTIRALDAALSGSESDEGSGR